VKKTLTSRGRFRALALALAIIAAVVVTARLFSGVPAAPAVLRPNIVVLMTDDQHNFSEDPTLWQRAMPHVSKYLFDQGVRFSKSFVSLSLCCPSRATLLTGQHAHNHTVWSNGAQSGGYEWFKFMHAYNNLATWLQSAGYHTAHIGKFLNGYGALDPTEVPPGWSEWYGSIDPTTYLFYNYKLNENGRVVQYGSSERDYQTDVYARKAVDFIRRRASASGPFFLWVAFLAPHTDSTGMNGPTPARRHRGYFENEPCHPCKKRSFNELDMSDKPRAMQRLPLLDATTISQMTNHYRRRLETLLAADDAVGAIIEALARSGGLENTVVIFTSDNGYFHGEHRVKWGKIRVYEESIRVPLALRGPGIPRGEIRDKLVLNTDLAPSILDLAQTPPSLTIDGRSLLPLLTDVTTPWRTSLLVEGVDKSYAAVRTDRFLYVEHATGERELYDLHPSVDPYQLRSVHGASAYQEILAQLERRLKVLRFCSGSSCG
jgi:arylsulfatase A-like enzyme